MRKAFKKKQRSAYGPAHLRTFGHPFRTVVGTTGATVNVKGPSLSALLRDDPFFAASLESFVTAYIQRHSSPGSP